MLCKRKILAIVGSNHEYSFTNKLIGELLNKIKTLNENYETKVICLKDYRIHYCIGCKTCFYKGFCSLDKEDDFLFIRNELLKADIVFFASPVYVHSVPGIMKTFFDRISTFTHLMNCAGKLGFTVTTTDSNGQDNVKKHLIKMQEWIGIKNLDNYIFVDKDNSISSFIEMNSKKLLECLEDNYSYTNRNLEKEFKFLKGYYNSMIDTKLGEQQQETFELNYWNQKWIKECKSFQEFASKNRKKIKSREDTYVE